LIAEGKVQVVVRSRRVPSRLIYVNRLQITYSGLWLGGDGGRVVLYESILDDEHKRAVEEGKRLADQLGLELEIIDESKSSLIKRALASFGRRLQSSKLVITPSYSPMGCTCPDSVSTAH
jgi:hypothetical protein